LKNKSLKFIDICSGIGGFHYALHQLGWKCVYASEIDEKAREVYKNNFYKISPELFDNDFFNNDIFKCDTSKIPDFDVICAGFPCQPFSQIGYRKGFNENFEGRGNLFFELLRILKDKKPKVFLFENVQHILKHDDGKTFKRISKEILDLGYSFYWKVIRASDFGLPQNRPRTFMVGFRDEKNIIKNFDFPKPLKLNMTMSDIFSKKCSRDIGFTLRLGGMGSGIHDRRNWDSYLVDGKVVKLQAEHGIKMQGFPSTFKLPKSRSVSLKLLGNSVAINVVKALGKEIDRHLTKKY